MCYNIPRSPLRKGTLLEKHDVNALSGHSVLNTTATMGVSRENTKRSILHTVILIFQSCKFQDYRYEIIYSVYVLLTLYVCRISRKLNTFPKDLLY